MSEGTKKNYFLEYIRELGPGLLLASAAVGGSHIVSATQAGANFGWQLLLLVIMVNLFKYPFFRFGSQYTLTCEKSLISGYNQMGKVYTVVTFALLVFNGVASVASVAMLCGGLLSNIFSGFSISILAVVVQILIGALLVFGGYTALDKVTKGVMFVLTFATVAAAVIAVVRRGVGPSMAEGPSPWNFATLPFLISLMGWMPAPMELSAINSMWIVAKKKKGTVTYKSGMRDFNIGFFTSMILAVIFLAMGALIQFGSGEAVQTASAAYIRQFVTMYSGTIGAWSGGIIGLIAFLCIFGTGISISDGYARAISEAQSLLFQKGGEQKAAKKSITLWILLISLAAMLICLAFSNDLGTLMRVSMIVSFLIAPVFAALNLKLILKEKREMVGKPMLVLAVFGLLFLIGFSLLFVWALATGRV